MLVICLLELFMVYWIPRISDVERCLRGGLVMPVGAGPESSQGPGALGRHRGLGGPNIQVLSKVAK